MKLYRCGRHFSSCGSSNPEGVGFMLTLTAGAIEFPSFSRTAGVTNGGDCRYGDVSLSLAAIDLLLAGVEKPDAILLDLAGAQIQDSTAAHAYLATIIDRIRGLVKAPVGLWDTAACADLCDFVAPDLSPVAPVGLSPAPHWQGFDAYRKGVAYTLMCVNETGKPIVAVLSCRYTYPGPLRGTPIGEPELSVALDMAGGCKADVALADDNTQAFCDLARRARRIIDPALAASPQVATVAE